MSNKQKSFEVSGTIDRIMDTEERNNFRIREFVLKIEDGNYPQLVKFQCVQDRCDILGNLCSKDAVTVTFDFRGREWNDKILTNLNAWKIVKDGDTQNPMPPAESLPGPNDTFKRPSEAELNSLPF